MSPIDAAIAAAQVLGWIAFVPWLIAAIRDRFSQKSISSWTFMLLVLGSEMCRVVALGGPFFAGFFLFEAWFAIVAGAFVALSFATRPRVPGAVEAAVVTAGLLGIAALAHASASGVAAFGAIASIITGIYAVAMLVRTFVATFRVAA